MIDTETLAVYAAKSEDYAALTRPSGDQRLAGFMAKLPDGARVLDLGCGPGFAAAAMAEAGMDVLATDAVAEMVALAARHPRVTAVQQHFDGPLAADSLDGIWANFCLLHAPRDAFPQHLQRLRTALKAGGRFHIGMKLGTGEARDSIGRLYTYYSEDELVAHLTTAGFTVTERATGRDVGLDGSEADWICLGADG